jgi:preprotein translocase subunit SecE
LTLSPLFATLKLDSLPRQAILIGKMENMAQKKKASRAKSTKSTSSSESVTRVRAVDTAPVAKKTVEPKETKVEKSAPKVEESAPKTTKKRKVSPKGILKPFKAAGAYFKGAWVELKQVRWPTRSATWEMTGAVLLYSAFFVVLILMLDAGFKYIFELILNK